MINKIIEELFIKNGIEDIKVSKSNRPDLWGHYGIARELSAIYNVPLKELPSYKIDKKLPKYNIEIRETEKCNRYVGVEIDGIYEKDSPMWMKSLPASRLLDNIHASMPTPISCWSRSSSAISTAFF